MCHSAQKQEIILILNRGACFGSYFDFVFKQDYPDLKVKGCSDFNQSTEEHDLHNQKDDSTQTNEIKIFIQESLDNLSLEVNIDYLDNFIVKSSGFPCCRCTKSIFPVQEPKKFTNTLIGEYCQG